jgi:hypothetical protein
MRARPNGPQPERMNRSDEQIRTRVERNERGYPRAPPAAYSEDSRSIGDQRATGGSRGNPPRPQMERKSSKGDIFDRNAMRINGADTFRDNVPSSSPRNLESRKVLVPAALRDVLHVPLLM